MLKLNEFRNQLFRNFTEVWPKQYCKNSDLSNMYSENIIHDYEDHGNMYSKELLNFFASQNIE